MKEADLCARLPFRRSERACRLRSDSSPRAGPLSSAGWRGSHVNGGLWMRLARYLFISIAALLLPQAALAQSAGDKGEEAAKVECKAKSDPSILVNYWKTAAEPARLRWCAWPARAPTR